MKPKIEIFETQEAKHQKKWELLAEYCWEQGIYPASTIHDRRHIEIFARAVMKYYDKLII